MHVRSLHRIIGIVLLIPFFGWALTGFVFFIKPGYEGAYEILAPKTYPLDPQLEVSPEPGWLEARFVKSILGNHLLVRTNEGWIQLDLTTRQPRRPPDETQLRNLMLDAFSSNPGRYGEVLSVKGNTVTTTTGVRVTLDWNRMALQQKGKDTDRIDLLYRIHYLQWTGVKTIDRVIGLAGIGLVLTLTMLGAWLAFKRA